MKNKKKHIPILLGLVFILATFMTVSALAASSATAEQDGVVATLACDKDKYAAGEKVNVTLTVQNNNPYSVDGIETEIILPDGIKAESGDLKQEAFSLDAGESKDGIVNLAKIPDKPIVSDSPKTGDDSLLGLYIAIMILSGGALVVIGIKQKWFHKKGVMSFVLFFAMAGMMFAPLAVNAASVTKSFVVENNIEYDGKDVTIKANISYLYEEHHKVTCNGVDTYYAVGDTVEITAPEPEEGKYFDGWTVVKGDATLADPDKASTSFVMPDCDVELEANYAVNTYTISATAGPNGTITETANVNYGDSKTFTITPNTGYHIVDVEVDGESKGAITSYTFENVKKTHTIEATFAIDTFAITASVNDSSMGTITETANVNYDGSKTFTITPNTGYHILDVEVDGVSMGAKTSYTFNNVKEVHTIRAVFAIDTFTITASVNDSSMGTITETANVNYGDSKTFTMTANSGYGVKDVKVDGTSVGPVTYYTFENVNENHTIEVEFDTATTVTTAQEFRDAVTRDGIIILANDITLDDNGNVKISNNVIIHGNGHSIVMARYSGKNWSRLVQIYIGRSANVMIENCSIKEIDGEIHLVVNGNSQVVVYGGVFDRISVEENSEFLFLNGTIEKKLRFTRNSKVSLVNGVFRSGVGSDWLMDLGNPNYRVDLDVCGGVYYFDPTEFLDANTYKATQTKDAAGADIWVVTEK